MIAVDLGTRITKAVFLDQRGGVPTLRRFAILDAPIFEKQISPELLTEHLRTVFQALSPETKNVTLAIGLDDAVVKQVDLPYLPKDEMRLVLKNNTKGYLQQDLPGHVFDCHFFPPKQTSSGKTDPAKGAGMAKGKVLVVGAKQRLVDDFQGAVRQAGLVPDHIVPGLIGPVNAFEKAMPDVFSGETIALVDIGFKHSSVCILDRGELALTRVVNIGADKLTAGLAEAMNVTYAEAEGIKIGMAPEVKSALEMQVMPLGRELRASLDFFEHQQDRPVTNIYLSGGSARSELILEMLHSELIVECRTWNPARSLQLALPEQQAAEIQQIGSQLAVAIGAGLTSFN